MRYLVKAKTGSFPTAGQSAKTLLSAVSADRGSDWFINSWSFGGTEPDPNHPFGYNDGQSFALSISISRGVKAADIQITGTGKIGVTPGTGNGFSVALSVNSISGATGSVTMDVTAPYNPAGSIVAGQHWFTGYTYPNEPPPGSGTLPVTMRAQLNGATSGGSTECEWTIYYKPDTPGSTDQFNPNLTKTWTSIPFNNRAEVITDFDIEWHNNSTYTDLYTTGASFERNSDPMQTWTYYLRAKRKTESTWSNLGAQTWTDPRLS